MTSFCRSLLMWIQPAPGIACNSPRDSAGFMIFPASMAPPPSPVPPAPTMVWISSWVDEGQLDPLQVVWWMFDRCWMISDGLGTCIWRNCEKSVTGQDAIIKMICFLESRTSLITSAQTCSDQLHYVALTSPWFQMASELLFSCLSNPVWAPKRSSNAPQIHHGSGFRPTTWPNPAAQYACLRAPAMPPTVFLQRSPRFFQVTQSYSWYIESRTISNNISKYCKYLTHLE